MLMKLLPNSFLHRLIHCSDPRGIGELGLVDHGADGAGRPLLHPPHRGTRAEDDFKVFYSILSTPRHTSLFGKNHVDRNTLAILVRNWEGHGRTLLLFSCTNPQKVSSPVSFLPTILQRLF